MSGSGGLKGMSKFKTLKDSKRPEAGVYRGSIYSDPTDLI